MARTVSHARGGGGSRPSSLERRPVCRWTPRLEGVRAPHKAMRAPHLRCCLHVQEGCTRQGFEGGEHAPSTTGSECRKTEGTAWAAGRRGWWYHSHGTSAHPSPATNPAGQRCRQRPVYPSHRRPRFGGSSQGGRGTTRPRSARFLQVDRTYAGRRWWMASVGSAEKRSTKPFRGWPELKRRVAHSQMCVASNAAGHRCTLLAVALP